MANYNDLGNISKMVDKDVHLTVSDMTFDELNEANENPNAPLSQISNSLIISAPQTEINGVRKDIGYYGLFVTDYNGRLCTLTPFNKIDADSFYIESENGNYVLKFKEEYVLNGLNATLRANLNDNDTIASGKKVGLKLVQDKGIAKRIEIVENDIASDTDLNNFKTQINNTLTSKINALDAIIRGNLNDNDSVQSGKKVGVKITETDGKITDVKVVENDIASASALQSLTNTVNGLHNYDDSNLKSRVRSLENTVSGLSNYNDSALQARVTNLENSTGQLNTNYNNLKNRLDVIVTQLNNWKQALDQAMLANHGDTYTPYIIFSAPYKSNEENSENSKSKSSYENNYSNNINWEYNF